MIKKIGLISLLFVVLLTYAKVMPEKKHGAQLRLLDSFLATHHYNNALLDDAKSKEVLANYLQSLDYGKQLFTRADIERYQRYETLMDDYAHKGDLSIAFEIYNEFLTKRKAQIRWVLARLDQPFDNDAPGSLELDRDKVDWAKDQAEIENRWEAMLTNAWITLRLAKQSDAKARSTLKKRYKNMTKRVNQTKPDEIFQYFANAISRVYDPHTGYFSPRNSENFDINMSLSLEGIGAQLTMEEEFITIKELIAGGPAKKSGQLGPNDKILGVAQGMDGAMEDIVGWRTDEAVQLIRGKRGTIVRLQIQKAKSDEIVEVVLTRDKIKLEESAAKSKIKRIEKGDAVYRIGVIELPSFYADFDAARRGDDDYRSTTRDVRKLIDQLTTEGIDGLLIDLRNNGGGSLAEAIDLTGLFFDEGPVVQVRRADGNLSIYEDDDRQTYYDGPLAVLINENSASASEILAGAIKDYRRGIILGEPTYGKGTVQTIIDFANFLPSIKDKVGQFKMTIAMFYRINGSSTQLKGVEPDLYIPNKESYRPGGESEEEHALAWRKIEPLAHEKFASIASLLPRLQAGYDKNNRNNPLMQNVLALYDWEQKQIDNTVVSLSLEKRRAEKQKLRDESLRFQNQFRKLYGYPLLTAAYLDKEEKDKTESEKEDDKKYEVDAILDIAAETVADYVRLSTRS
ncbi:MAG: tail-specific protease [Gammaproteobacteria bacterium]|nr:MAG: tail-specific protease [Gammaproteobacteria bacterium]